MDTLGCTTARARAGRLGLWLLVATTTLGCRDDETALGADDGASTGELEGSGSGQADEGSSGEPEAYCGNGVVDPGEVCDEALDDHHGTTCNARCEIPGTLLWSWETDLRLIRAVPLADGDVGLLGYHPDGSARVGRLTPPSDLAWEHTVSGFSGGVQLLAAGDRLFVSTTDAESGDHVLHAWSASDGSTQLDALSLGDVDDLFELDDGLLAIEGGWPLSFVRLDLDGEPQWTAEQTEVDGHTWTVEGVAVLDGSIMVLLHDPFGLEDPQLASALLQIDADGTVVGKVPLDLDGRRAHHLAVADGRLFVAGPASSGGLFQSGGWMAEVDGTGAVVHSFDPIASDLSMSTVSVDSFGHPVVTGALGVDLQTNGIGAIVRYGASSSTWTIELGDDRHPRAELADDDEIIVMIAEPDQRSSVHAYTP